MCRPRLVALIVLLLAVLTVAAAPAPAEVEKDDDKKVPASLLTQLPPDAIFVITDSTAKLLEMIPGAVVITPERFRSLTDENARLRQQLERPAQPPTSLAIKGKVEAGLVTLTAEYGFRTDTPGTLVRLGGFPAQAAAVSLDGKTPRLIAGKSGDARPGKGREEDGFSVHIDKAGDHQLTLELVLPLLSRGGGQGFTLDLPRAAITSVELELPSGSREVRLGGKLLNGSLLALKDNRLSGLLGASERLELDWRSAQAASASAVLAARGAVHVRLDKQETLTKAVLTLEVQSGQTKQWRLVVPSRSEVSLAPADESRARVEPVNPKQPTLRIITVKEGSEPLIVTVTSRADAPKLGAGKRAAIGPFNVIGAVRQQGSVLVSSNVAEWHVEPSPRGDLTRRAATEEELRNDPGLVAAFRYGPGEGGERLAGLPWLEIEVEAMRGQLKARLAQTLALVRATGMAPDEKADALRWQVQTSLTVTPRRAGIDRFAVSFPPGCEPDESSIVLPDRVRSSSYDSARRLLEFRLPGVEAEALAPITVKFDANYPLLDPKAAPQTSLALPRPQGMLEHDGTLRVVTPSSVELVPLPADRMPELELVRQSVHELNYRYPRRPPDRVEVAWRAFRPVLRVDSLIDLTLALNQGRVRQELRHQLPGGTTPRLTLRVPDALASSLRLTRGGQLTSLVGGIATIQTAAAQPVVELEYTFATAADDEGTPIPLVVPDGDCRGETQVRIWSESGALPLTPRAGWLEQQLEEVPGRSRLPALVLRSPRLDQPLVLRTAADDDARILVERCLIRAAWTNEGIVYQARYRLARFAGRHLDFHLPGASRSAEVKATLDGKAVAFDELPPAAGARPDRFIRLRLSSTLLSQPGILELAYRVTPDRVGRSTFTTTLMPPMPLGESPGVPARWQIETPPALVLLGPEPGLGSPLGWSWRGWLWTPRAQTSDAELEAWLTGTSPTEAPAYPSLVLWREVGEPVVLTHVSRQIWLVACSLLAAGLGLALVRLGLSPRRARTALAWTLGGLALLAILAVCILAPGLAAQIGYGVQPGLVVLAILLPMQWLFYERDRRRVVFLPSFSRTKAGSSLVRHEAAWPRGEPSTVDAPRPAGSSVERGA